MSNLVILSLCCNDYRNGMFSGRCPAIALDDEALTLESPYGDSSLKCAIESDWFRLGKSQTWQHHGHTTWFGNWCWDAVLVVPGCAADVLNFALVKGYRPTVGQVVLWDKIERLEPLTTMDLAPYAMRERRVTR